MQLSIKLHIDFFSLSCVDGQAIRYIVAQCDNCTSRRLECSMSQGWLSGNPNPCTSVDTSLHWRPEGGAPTIGVRVDFGQQNNTSTCETSLTLQGTDSNGRAMGGSSRLYPAEHLISYFVPSLQQAPPLKVVTVTALVGQTN